MTELNQGPGVRTFNSWGRYTPGTQFKSWLFTICRNLVDEIVRRRLQRVLCDYAVEMGKCAPAAIRGRTGIRRGWTMSFLDRPRSSVRGGPAANGGGMRPDMPTCEEALAVIYEFLDGELDAMSRDRVQAHFDVCGKCYPKLRFEESFRAAVQRASTGETPPPDLRARLLEALEGARQVDEDS